MEDTQETPKDLKISIEKTDSLLSSEGDGSEFETDLSDYYESDYDLQLISPPSSGLSDSSEDIMVFEHTLKHKSFFTSTRKRRRRHTINRLKGVIPPLHFTGSCKTNFWTRYGVQPADILPSGNIQGIDTMFPADEFKKLGPSERRIHVNGQKFKIVPNQGPSKTLHSAIANAVGLCGNNDYKVVRDAILDEMYENWPTYSREVCQFCLVGEKGYLLELQRSDPRVILETYKKLTNKQNEPPADLELSAAARRYGFHYSVMELDSIETPIKVKDCAEKSVLENGSVKYHFLKCAFGGFLISYEFLVPIGPLKKIQDGEYPVIIRDVILVERSVPGQSSTIVEDQINRPFLGPIPVGFALDHRAFFHRSTITHDLWSLLAELLYGKLIHAPHIKRKIVDGKQNFMLYYLACKAKKRYQVNGNAELQRIADEFNERFSQEQPRGTVEDLAQAAAYYNFSYTLIGMDCKGNFYWADRNRDEDDSEDNPYFAFFVKTTPDRSMHWYALADIGKYCPKEQKQYGNVQLGDLRKWGGKFYFHDVPRKLQDQTVTPGRFSSKNLVTTQTRKLIQARQWASTGIGRLRSSITALYSTSSQLARSTYQKLTDFIRWLLSRRRVNPDKTVTELFVREKP